jgi:UrcA family protein
MKTFALSSIAVLSLIAAGAAHADVVVPTSTVKYGDLDLSHTAGEATLYHRINQAARKVCASLDVSQSVAPLSMGEAYKACLRNAVSGAVAKIDKPEFTAYVTTQTSPGASKPARLASVN